LETTKRRSAWSGCEAARIASRATNEFSLERVPRVRNSYRRRCRRERRRRDDRNQFLLMVTVMIVRSRGSSCRVFKAAALATLLVLVPWISPKAQTLAERTNRGLVTIITSSTDGTALRVAEDLSYVLDSTGIRRILPVV